MVTDNLSEADEFFVVPCEESGHSSRHFSIFYNSESKLKQPETKPKMRVKPIPRYLCTCVNFRGISDGPLELKLNAKESKSMLMLQDRRSKHLHPAEISDWINGKEIFYINCKHRSFKKDSYICVTATNPALVERHGASTSSEADTIEGEGEASAAESVKKRSTGASGGATAGAAVRKKTYSYTTCCKPSISAHDDRTTFMLFRLIRVKQNVDWDKYDDPSDATERGGQDGEKGAKTKKMGKEGRNTRQPTVTEVDPEE